MTTTPSKAALWGVQQREYPDSVMLTEQDLHALMRESFPSWLATNYKVAMSKPDVDSRWNILFYDSENERRRDWLHYAEMEILRLRHQLAVSIASCLMTAPHGIFYACCKKDGVYRYMGHRYGLEPSEYMSGFMVENFEVEGK